MSEGPRRWGAHITAAQSRGRFGVVIAGTGAHLPGEPLDNDTYLSGRDFPTTSHWIRDHTGIESRHHAEPGVNTSDIAAAAALEALDAAGVSPSEVGRILLCTTTGDWTSPASAARVQALIGAECPVMDIQSACASWIYGLDAGVRMVKSGLENVLVIGADTKSRFVGTNDHRLGPILADGGGAVLLQQHDGPGGFHQIELYADGSKAKNMYTPAGGSEMPASATTVAEDLHSTQMHVPGRTIKEHASAIMGGLIEQVCDQHGVACDEVDWVVPHQANGAIVKHLADRLGLDTSRIVKTITHTGNIVAGTLPYSYDHLTRCGNLRAGQLVVFATAGAGYTGGAAIYEVPDD